MPHDSVHCPICQGAATSGSMTDEEFNALLLTCQDELATKQAKFQETLAQHVRWDYDLDAGTLRLGDEQFAITVAGTYSAKYESWLWGWANEDFPATARENSARLKQLHDLTGFRVFAEPGTSATSVDAQVFTALAIHLLDGLGLFRVPGENDGPTLYFAVQAKIIEQSQIEIASS